MAVGIVGATGFIGSCLRHGLAQKQQPLKIFTRCAAKVPLSSELQVIEGDLFNEADCKKFVLGLHTIYYLAHTNTPVNADLDQATDVGLNLPPLLTLLRAVRKLETKPHIVYFGSGGAVYAQSAAGVPYRESAPCSPASSYGIVKLAAEQYLRLAAERGELTATVLRIGNAYGTLLPQHRMQGLIGVALNQILHHRPVRVFGNPDNVRDYVHLDDVQAMAMKAAHHRQAYDVVNVGSGTGYSVRDVLSIIRDCLGAPFPIEWEESRGKWLTDWVVLDNSHAKDEYGWTANVGLHHGIAGMLAALVDGEVRGKVTVAQ